MATTSLQSWALPRLQPLLPLPEEDLLQAISYAASLSSPEAVSQHFKDFLGESSDSLQFISEFNAQRFPSNASASSSRPAPSNTRGKRTKKPPINRYASAPRQPNEGLLTNPAGAYMKSNSIDDEYFTGGSRKASPAPQSFTPPKTSTPPPSGSSKATGTLTSDLINVKTKAPKAAHKLHITGGTSMRGPTSELTDFESALRSLEISTNPTLNTSDKPRICNCQGIKHELLAAAPNCLHCGKIICIYEGLQPCSFCHRPLLSGSEVHAMIQSLRAERGREKMAMDAHANRKTEVGATPRPFATPKPEPEMGEDEGLKKAQEHRDRLLGFQAQNAQRTKIIDQAADFDTGHRGTNMWASPEERALQLKKQQKALRNVEWSNKQDYEKRRVVVAIDLKGRKVVKEMQAIAGPDEDDEEEEPEEEEFYDDSLSKGGQGMAAATIGGRDRKYARNPLLRGLVKPVYVPDASAPRREKKDTGWRRVQDSLDDNERVILDGGAMGGIAQTTDSGM